MTADEQFLYERHGHGRRQMKIVTANGKRNVVMTRKEWEAIGKKAQWNNPGGGLNNIDKLVDSVYDEVFKKGRTSQDYDIRDEFYAFLTGGAQSLGFGKYHVRKITKDEYAKFQAAFIGVANNIKIDKNKWTPDAGATWWSFFKRGTSNKDASNYKRYLSLATPKLQRLRENFSFLLEKLYDVPSVFSCKMPADAAQFVNAVDDIVIYFRDAKDKDKIEDAIRQSGIALVDRKSLHRSDYGQDKTTDSVSGKKSSDTELLSKQYAESFQKIMNHKDGGVTNLSKLKGHQEADAKKYLKQVLERIFNEEAKHRDVKL